MEHLIFYKKDTDLKPSVEKHKFSYTRAYTMVFIQSAKSLGQELTKYPKALLYYFCDTLNNEDRIALSNIISRFENIRICLCTNAKHALQAWKLNVFDFKEHPIDNQKLQETYRKMLQAEGGDIKAFKIKTNQGLFTIPFKSVNYLKADGNYTKLGLIKDKSFVETKQLQFYEFCCENDHNMKRIHRSYIMNFRNIKRVTTNQVFFYNSQKPIDVSLTLAKNIKRALLSK